MKRIDATHRAKVVLRLSGIELVERQFVFALHDTYIVQVGRYGYGAAHAAVRTVAPAHAAQPIGQNHTKAYSTTMARRVKFAAFVKVRGGQNCTPLVTRLQQKFDAILHGFFAPPKAS